MFYTYREMKPKRKRSNGVNKGQRCWGNWEMNPMAETSEGLMEVVKQQLCILKRL